MMIHAPIPTECPLCGASIETHSAETADDYESSVYFCGLDLLVMENGKLYPSADCAEATNKAIDAINTKWAALTTGTAGKPGAES